MFFQQIVKFPASDGQAVFLALLLKLEPPFQLLYRVVSPELPPGMAVHVEKLLPQVREMDA